MALFFYTTAFKQRIPIGDLLLVGQAFGGKRRTLPIHLHKNNAIGIVLREHVEISKFRTVSSYEKQLLILRFPTLFSYDNKPTLIRSISYRDSKASFRDTEHILSR
ncbi:MAG: hypothetical protein SOZ18_05165 [Phocaeicola sp.]|nr:hypothetical protein [Phocaeicola sp.]